MDMRTLLDWRRAALYRERALAEELVVARNQRASEDRIELLQLEHQLAVSQLNLWNDFVNKQDSAVSV